MRKLLGVVGAWSLAMAAFGSPCVWGQAGQVVQMPTLGTFSVDTSVSVPDSGAGFLGSSGKGQWGSVTRGGIPRNRGIGSQVTLPMASVHVQILDLDALDQAILAAAQGESNQPHSQRASVAEAKKARPNPKAALPMGSNAATENQAARDRLSGARKSGRSTPRSSSSEPLSPYPPKDDPTFGSLSSATNSMHRDADYNYLATLSHPSLVESNDRTSDDVRFYLNRAQAARRNGQWASAQLFYEQAWGRLSDSKQKSAIDFMNQVERTETETQKGKPKTGR